MIHLLRILILLWFIADGSLLLHSQYPEQISGTNKKATKLFHSALEAYQLRNYESAILDLTKAIALDSSFTEVYILLGDIHSETGHYPEAIAAYSRALELKPEELRNLYLITANLELMTGDYQDAKNHYLKFLAFSKIPSDKRFKAEQGINSCEFALEWVSHPVPFDPVNLGDSINTRFDEYINGITSDGELLFFTRKRAKDSLTLNHSNPYEEDFFVAIRNDNGWNMAREMGPPVNTHGNEGALCISPDGQRIFFAACHREDGLGSCDLYQSHRDGGHWSEPENLGPVVNSGAWDSQPSFSSDGKTLYFASKRPGGKGSSDIWMTSLQPDGSWSIPENLGDSVNTKFEEMAPFIHPDNQTLYFASRGHPGLGGLDLYQTKKDSSGRWKTPVNLGYPLNTCADEITLLVNTKGDLAYISSDKLGGKGRQDIYSFVLYPAVRPIPCTYFKGKVFDAQTRRKLEARFILTDLNKQQVVAESFSDPSTGEFLLVLPTDRNYALNVSCKGYLFYSEHFALSGIHSIDRPFLKDIPLKPIRIGESVILKNIFFDTDRYELKPTSISELTKLLELLQKNPNLKVEISGHTDNQGSAEYNIVLSQNRARAVFDYLTSNGISPSRLTFSGYGLSRHIDSNDTPEGRANNRRTEFRVTGL